MPWVYQGHTLGSKEFPPEFTPPYIDLNYDIDGFNYTVSPSELVDTFGKLTQVTLGFHDPRLRDIPYYANWVVLGTGPAVLKVCARFKDLVLQAYQGSHTLQASNYPTTMIEGSQQVSLLNLVLKLKEVNCTSVRVQAYGMKFPMGFYKDLPWDYLGNPKHPLASTNFWDIGHSYPQVHIILAQAPNLNRGTCTTFPMLMKLVKGYGSLSITTTYRGSKFKIKVYPLLVHAMKATSGKFKNFNPSTIRSCRVKETNLMNRKSKLSKFPRQKLGGLRLEVTTTGFTLMEAKYKIDETEFLILPEYLNPSKPYMEEFQLRLKYIRKEDYLANFSELLLKAQQLGVFRGRDQGKAGKVRRYILQDLFNALGWNQGTRTNRWEHELGPWWTWVPTQGDIDSALDVQVQTTLNFMDPLLEDSHLKELLRCTKIFKRGTKYRAVVQGQDGKNLTIGSCPTKLELGKLLFAKYKYQWTKFCYLVEQPFPSSTQVGTNLDLELDKYNLPDTREIGPLELFHELQGSSKYLVTQGYIKGDGSCQFRAVSKLVYGHQKYHPSVRREVVEYLQLHPDLIEAMLVADQPRQHAFSSTRSPATYLASMANPGYWGDDATLSAAATIYKLSLVIVNPDRTHFELSKVQAPLGWKALYYTGNHYELLFKVPSSSSA